MSDVEFPIGGDGPLSIERGVPSGEAEESASRRGGPEPMPRLPPGTVLRETYQIVRLITQGGMGEVYEATHTRVAGRFAVKVLRGDLSQDLEASLRFRREATITSRLRHPGIVNVLDFDATPSGRPYLVMEFLEGEDLAELLARRESRPLIWIADVVSQIAAALGFAHMNGVVHRDLKPQNVFLIPESTGRRRVKVLDFGISQMHALSQRLTSESALLGTPPYMSPEQAVGRAADVDTRADQFALATLAYELVTGRRPFDGENVMALFYQIVNVEPPPMGTWVPDVAPALERVVRRGLAKDREARFPSIDAFAAAFAEALTSPAGAAARVAAPLLAPASSSTAPGLVNEKRSGRRPSLGRTLGALLTVGVALATWALWPKAMGPTIGKTPSEASAPQKAALPIPARPSGLLAVPLPEQEPAAVAPAAIGPPPFAQAPEAARARPLSPAARRTKKEGHRATPGPGYGARTRADRGRSPKSAESGLPAAPTPPPGGTILRDL